MEIIRRESKYEKEDLSNRKMQVSFNSWGHLAIRLFDEEDKKSKDKEMIIVFDMVSTLQLIRFIQRRIKLDD